MTEGRPRRPDKKPLTRTYIAPGGLTPKDLDNPQIETKNTAIFKSRFIVRRKSHQETSINTNDNINDTGNVLERIDRTVSQILNDPDYMEVEAGEKLRGYTKQLKGSENGKTKSEEK